MKIYINQSLVIDSKDHLQIEESLQHWANENRDQLIVGFQLQEETEEGDWLQFIRENAKKTIEVTLITGELQQMKREMKRSAQDYTARIQHNLPSIIDPLYGQHAEKQEGALGDLFEGVNYLISAAEFLHLEEVLQGRKESVEEMFQAYEEKDYVEIADLLQYDWLPWVEKYHQKLQSLGLE